jgi:hypothetical protein
MPRPEASAGVSAVGLYLVMYSPAKATLEVWRMRHGARYVSQLDSMLKGISLGHTHVRPTGPISFPSLCCEKASTSQTRLTFFYLPFDRCINLVSPCVCFVVASRRWL